MERSSSFRKRLVRNIAPGLVSHAQASLTIESSTVWVQHHNLIMGGGPLKVLDLEPIPGLDNLPKIKLPAELEDPDTNSKVKTGEGYLELKTSDKNLRNFGHHIPRNVIRIRNNRNIVSNWSVPDLVLCHHQDIFMELYFDNNR